MNEGKNKKKFTLTNFVEIVTVAYLLCFFVMEPIFLLTKNRFIFPITVLGTLFALVFVILDRLVRKYDELEQKLLGNKPEEEVELANEQQPEEKQDIFTDEENVIVNEENNNKEVE